MTTRTIDAEQDRALLMQFIKRHAIPFTVDITKGRRRSVEQNKLQRLWLREVAEQMGDRTSEEVRGYCKLHIGVPILREENEAFREKYDAVVRPLPYEAKLAIMMEPLDMPVTRLMTTGQKVRYLDNIYTFFTSQGLVLTDPEKRRAA